MRRRYGRGICCNLTLTGSSITSHDDRCAAGLADAIGKGTGVDERGEAHVDVRFLGEPGFYDLDVEDHSDDGGAEGPVWFWVSGLVLARFLRSGTDMAPSRRTPMTVSFLVVDMFSLTIYGFVVSS